jgi:hypothetical protein
MKKPIGNLPASEGIKLLKKASLCTGIQINTPLGIKINRHYAETNEIKNEVIRKL